MARTTGRAKAQQDISSFSIPEGTELVDYRLKKVEDDLEKRHRLRLEFLSFVFKELLPYLLSIGLILVTSVYCFWVLWQSSRPSEERKWAMSIITALLTAIVGFAFGKSTK